MVHIYKHENEFYPSVTTIISAMAPVPEALANWKLNSGAAGVKKMKDSQIIGTLAHYRILNKLSPSLLDPPDFSPSDLPKGAVTKVDMCEIMFDALELDIGYPRRIEKIAFSKEYKYAGTPDLVAPVGNVHTLVDLKTSKSIYLSHKLQLGGYYELLGSVPERGLLISINPDKYSNPHMRAHTVEITKDELESYREQFLDMAKEFHKKNMTESLIKDHELSFNNE